jgi:hypothetical protein
MRDFIMAHDLETELARKIRSVETQPVLWKKHEVWSAIHDQIAPQERRSRVYYYAAALIILMFAHADSLRENLPLSVPLPHRDQAVATTIDPPVKDQLPDKPSEAIINDRKKPAQVFRRSIDPPNFEPAVASAAVTQLHQVNIESKQIMDVLPVQLQPEIIETSIAAEEPLPQTRIRAIVGVVSPTGNEPDVPRARRKLFHKLEPPEMDYEQTRSNSIVIARLK